MTMITILIPFVIVALIIVFVAGVKVQTEEEDGDLLKNIYIYLVLFATLMMSIGGTIGAFMSLADIVSPVTYTESFEEYKMWNTEYDGEKEVVTKSDAELREGYEAKVVLDKENSVKQAYNSLIKSFGWIVIPLPVFIYFQRRLNKHKE